MSRFQRLSDLYEFAEMPIHRIAIWDALLQTYSKEVRKLNVEMRDWADISTDWEEVLAHLRRADWRLRNQPAIFVDTHPGKLNLAVGLSMLEGLYSGLGDELEIICRSISANGNEILRSDNSTLNSNLLNSITESHAQGADNVVIVLRQEDLVGPCKELLSHELNEKVTVDTAFGALQKKYPLDKLIVVGNSLDYTSSLFSCLYSKYGTTLIGHSWVPEQNYVGTALSVIAHRSIQIQVLQSETPEENSSIDVSHFLEPSLEIASRELRSITKNLVSRLDRTNVEEEDISCKAYLLAGDNFVFLPIKQGAIESIDLFASKGSRVQRIPINSINIGSVILLRIGKSDSDSIFEMANAIGGHDALEYRRSQKEWKERLLERISTLGAQVVINQLKALGIPNPWIREWKSVKHNIRPDSDESFRILLNYLAVETEETIRAMNALRRLHLMAAMRLRKLLKEKFEQADLQIIQENGFLVEDFDSSPEIAKLGAFVCRSIGDEVFDIPESAVKQLQRAVM